MRSLKASRSTRIQIAQESHPNCVICNADDPLGLGLEFQAEQDGGMSVTINDGLRFQGYSNQWHGGIISMLFDAVMTHCLFAHGLTGVTASLNVRFLQPVISDQPVIVSARVEKQKSHLRLLKGTLRQDGELKSKAEARFWVVSHVTVSSK